MNPELLRHLFAYKFNHRHISGCAGLLNALPKKEEEEKRRNQNKGFAVD